MSYHLDHLGTPRRITDDTDGIVGTHDYFPFGTEAGGGQNEPSLSLLKFTGHERDLLFGESWETLDYMHARFESATLGRFLSVDPSRFSVSLRAPQSWNRYSYAVNNPTNVVDPNGAEPCDASVIAELPEGTPCEQVTAADPEREEREAREEAQRKADAFMLELMQHGSNILGGVGDGILSTLSFGLVRGGDLRRLTGADEAVDQCSAEYLGGRVAGTTIALAAYATGAIPSTLTHFTTRAGAAGIAESGFVNAGAGIFGRGAYAATARTAFVPAASTVPVTISSQGFIRIIPNAVYIGGGDAVTAGWFAAYGGAANRDMATRKCELRRRGRTAALGSWPFGRVCC